MSRTVDQLGEPVAGQDVLPVLPRSYEHVRRQLDQLDHEVQTLTAVRRRVDRGAIAARDAGATFQEIADCLGISRQSAHGRYAGRSSA